MNVRSWCFEVDLFALHRHLDDHAKSQQSRAGGPSFRVVTDIIPALGAPSFRVLCERVGSTNLKFLGHRSVVPTLATDPRVGHPQLW